MADNDRFKISKVKKPIECKGCEYDFETCEITCIHNYGQGKTRAEYENMIAESIYNEKLLRMTKSGIFSNINPDSFAMTLLTKSARVESLYLAKAVVARLFGEGE